MRRLPPIHDTARLWLGDEPRTLQACVRYRQHKKPGWSLTFLRDTAGEVLSGRLTESALVQAINANVPPRSRDSVLKGVRLLLGAANKYQLRGHSSFSRNISIGRGFSVGLKPAGRFYSESQKERFLIAVQPRLGDFPNIEQMRIWISALYHEFCCDPLEPLTPLILDISKHEVTKQRHLRELNVEKCPIIEKHDLDDIFDLIASCYQQAIEIVPDKPSEKARKTSLDQGELF